MTKTLIILFSIISFNTCSQENFGYFGKTSYFEITSTSFLPIIYNLTTNGDSQLIGSNGLISGKNWFNSGLRVAIGNVQRANLAVSVETGYNRYRIYGTILKNEYTTNLGTDIRIYDHEDLKVNSFILLPKVELSGRNGLLPNGLVHQVGAGISVNLVQDKDYVVKFFQSSSSDTIIPGYKFNLGDHVNFSNKYFVYKIMYGLKMRKPISKGLMINYGLRYSLDFSLPFRTSQEEVNISRKIIRYNLFNVIRFDLGLTIPYGKKDRVLREIISL